MVVFLWWCRLDLSKVWRVPGAALSVRSMGRWRARAPERAPCSMVPKALHVPGMAYD